MITVVVGMSTLSWLVLKNKKVFFGHFWHKRYDHIIMYTTAVYKTSYIIILYIFQNIK